MNSNNGNKLDRVMRFPEIAGVLGVCVRSVRRMIDRGELPPCVRVGRVIPNSYASVADVRDGSPCRP